MSAASITEEKCHTDALCDNSTSSPDDDLLIKEGDHVIFKKDNVLKAIQIRKKRTMFIEKMKFSVNGAIGHPYGSQFEISKGNLIRVLHDQVAEVAEEGRSADNRDLYDRNLDNQKLSREAIEEMKKEGVRGGEIIDHIIENSKTFKTKTSYSQEKYIKKKKKKHLPIYAILKPCTRLISEMYHNKGPARILNLRLDSLAQILNQANIRAGGRYIVVENTLGMVLASILDRMAGRGSVVNIFSGTDVFGSRPAVDLYNFSQQQLDVLHHYPMTEVQQLTDHPSEAMTESENDKSNIDTANSGACPSSEDNSIVRNVDITNVNDREMVPNAVEGKEIKQDTTDLATTDSSSVAVADSTCGDALLKDKCSDSVKVTHTDSPELGDKGPNDAKDDSAMIDTTTAADTQCDDDKQKKRFRYEKEEHREKQAEWRNKVESSKKLLLKGSFDSLIVASKFHPTPIVLSLIELLAPSRPFIVFSQYKEPLLDCYSKLRDRGRVVYLRFSETFYREIQVLPERTHPLVNMSATGGYLLTGTTTL